jgi:hypothetical protein
MSAAAGSHERCRDSHHAQLAGQRPVKIVLVGHAGAPPTA